MKKFLYRLRGYFFRLFEKDETERLILGSIASKMQDYGDSNLHNHEFKIFSQYGDDGIIQYLVKNLDISNKTFIEFGVESYSEANTRFLLMNNNWSGLVIDGSRRNIGKLRRKSWYWNFDLESEVAFIDVENINSLICRDKFRDLGLLHIDIDGNDYHILKAIDIEFLNPALMILEYNAVFGVDRSISVPYDAKFVRNNAHYSNLYFGASLSALNGLCDAYGYDLIGCNSAGNNAYFVRRDLVNESIKCLTTGEAFVDSKFRESRDIDYGLSLLSGGERLEALKGLPVLNVITGEIEEL